MPMRRVFEINANYRGALACWEEFTQNLKAFCSETKRLHELVDFQDKFAIKIQLTQTVIVCEFEFKGEGFEMKYSFGVMDEHCRRKWIESSRQVVDKRGMTLAPGSSTDKWNVSDKERVQHIFFPPVIQAQQSAWMYNK